MRSRISVGLMDVSPLSAIWISPARNLLTVALPFRRPAVMGGGPAVASKPGREADARTERDDADRSPGRCRRATAPRLALSCAMSPPGHAPIGRASCRERVCQYV